MAAGGHRPVKHRHPSHRPIPAAAAAAAAAGFASPLGTIVPTGKRAARALALPQRRPATPPWAWMDSELDHDGDGGRGAGPGPGPPLHMSPRAVTSAAASALRAAQVQAKEAAQQRGRTHAGSVGGSGAARARSCCGSLEPPRSLRHRLQQHRGQERRSCCLIRLQRRRQRQRVTLSPPTVTLICMARRSSCPLRGTCPLAARGRRVPVL